jgi:hypothetical protein
MPDLDPIKQVGSVVRSFRQGQSRKLKLVIDDCNQCGFVAADSREFRSGCSVDLKSSFASGSGC